MEQNRKLENLNADLSNLSREKLEQVIFQVLQEKMGNACQTKEETSVRGRQQAHGVIQVDVPSVRVTEADRLDTKKAGDLVYTHDLFSLTESPRLGCGVMEMKKTTFDWTLNYDEIDYVIEGSLSVRINGSKVTAGPGEVILIPKGSSISFSVPEYARFLYVTYPADWEGQG